MAAAGSAGEAARGAATDTVEPTPATHAILTVLKAGESFSLWFCFAWLFRQSLFERAGRPWCRVDWIDLSLKAGETVYQAGELPETLRVSKIHYEPPRTVCKLPFA